MADNVTLTYSTEANLRVYDSTKDTTKLNATTLKPSIIEKYIQKNSTRLKQMKEDYLRFSSSSVPVFDRRIGYLDENGGVVESSHKINRKINNDFAGYIVRTKASFLCSNPVSISFRDLTEVDEEDFKEIMIALDDFKILNNWGELLIETAERIGATGEGAWIISIEEVDGQVIEKINNLYAWEVVEVVEGQLYIRHYQTVDENLEDVYYVDVYDNTNIVRYLSDQNGGSLKHISTQKHLFKVCPVVRFLNNDQAHADFYNVKSLIDQYDRTLSDLASEVEQFRLSYLVLTGVEATAEQVSAFQQTGVFQIKKPEGKAEFIVKQMAIEDTLKLLDKIEKNIFRFAESFDATSDTYTGNLTNFAIFFKTAPLSGRAKKTANFMKQGLYRTFRIIQDTWILKGKDMDYLDLKFDFTFAEARNIKEEIETLVNAGGRVSNETLLGLMSFIDSPANELARLKNEQSEEGLFSGIENIWYNDFNQMQHALANSNNTSTTNNDNTEEDKTDNKE
ncbi:MAG: phage portal protein [Peptostreptococcaceae bacterium]